MNPEIERIISQLPAGDQEKMREHLEDLYGSQRTLAYAAIWVQNFSHGIGRNIDRFPGGKES